MVENEQNIISMFEKNQIKTFGDLKDIDDLKYRKLQIPDSIDKKFRVHLPFVRFKNYKNPPLP